MAQMKTVILFPENCTITSTPTKKIHVSWHLTLQKVALSFMNIIDFLFHNIAFYLMHFTARRRKRSANITPIKPARIYPSKAISKDKSYNGVSAGRAFKTPKEAIIAKSKDQTKGVNEILNPLERLKNNVQDSQKSRLPPPPFVEVGNQTYKVLPVFLGDPIGIRFILIL